MANNAIQIFDGTPTEVITDTTNADDAEIVGGDAIFDNTTDLWPMAIATFFATGFGADPSGGSLDLYCMKGNVGSGTEDEDAGGITYGLDLSPTSNETQTQGLHYLGSFRFDVDTGAQRQAINISLLGIKEAYFYVDNNLGTSITQPYTLDIEGFTFTPSA